MAHTPDHYVGDELENVSVAETEAAYTLAKERYFTASEHEKVIELREAIVELGMRIDLLVPAGRNKSLALTALEDVQMRANRGIFAPGHLR